VSYGFQFDTVAVMMLPTTPPGRNKERISTFVFSWPKNTSSLSSLSLLLAAGTREFDALSLSRQAKIRRTGLQVQCSARAVHTDFPTAWGAGTE
jgi:hypothetical protein